MKRIVFLTGAGMSVESGFKTFRGNDGLWENYPVQQVASHEGWLANPALVTEFYNNMRKKLYNAEPNAGHRLIAEMERDYDVTVITQNVDDLHERAGSKRVIHLHGELLKVCSSVSPDDPRYQVTLTEDNCEVAPGTKAGDGSLLRPFIVFFGEAVPMISVAAEATAHADLFVIVGTSLNVYPAARLVGYVPAQCPVCIIDPEPVTANCNRRVTQLRCGASEGMRRLRDRIGEFL